MMDDRNDLPLSELRTPPPLRPSDYAAIRARVRSEMEQRPRRRFMPLFGWAFAAAVLVIVAFVTLRREPAAHIAPPAAAMRKTTTQQVAVVAAPPVQPAPQPRPPATSNRRPNHHHHHRKLTSVQVASHAPAQIRIQIQTADPDVRIIWIPNEPQSTSTKEKS